MRIDEMKKENFEYCKRIALEVEAYANGEKYRCPECGDIIENEKGSFDDETELYHLPCGCKTPYEPEQLSLYDYFEDVLDIEYHIASDRETVLGASFWVTLGGPNVKIDTYEKAVKLFWWGERAEYPLLSEVCEEINQFAQELWGC